MNEEDVITTEEEVDAVAPASDPDTQPVTPPVADAPVQDETPAEPEPAAAADVAPDIVQPEAGEPAAPDETAAPEPAPTEPKEEETMPAASAPPGPAEAVEVSNAPYPPLKVRGGGDGGVMGEESGVAEAPLPPKEPPVKEIIIEKEKPLSDSDKEQIFKDKLNANLIRARGKKHAQFEERLQAIVDFIRQKGTLVTNQDIEEGLAISDATATRQLNTLIQRGLVVRLGDQRHAKYKLAQAL